ncbi:MAG: DNA polymerase I [Halobacteriovoraceae bacterium]|nr:DNA polymerase I [Halobacteriovoraceae bacterium]
MTKKLIIVDISSFIFRAFYAIRLLHSSDGTPVNAVHGVTSMLLKLLADYRPTHLFIARDSRGPSFRKKIFPQYKANRQAPPEELIPQFGLIEELVNKMKIPNLVLEGYEADDVIGSAAVQLQNKFDEVLIASGDKDLMQFVGENVKMLDTMKDKIYDRDQVFEKMNVWPEQIVDYLSILGDASDNIPGMKGIGAKGAARLLAQYRTLEGCVQAREKLTGKRLIESFKNHLDDAYLSKKLIEIKTDLNLGISADDICYKFEVKSELVDFFKKLNLELQLKKIEEINDAFRKAKDNDARGEFAFNETQEGGEDFTYKVVTEEKDFRVLEENFKKGKEGVIHLEFDHHSNFFSQKLISVSISFDGKTSWYLPFNHSNESLGKERNLNDKYLNRILSSSWENSKAKLICLFAKRDFLYGLVKNKQFRADFFDVTQAHFVVAPQDRHDLSFLVSRYIKNNTVVSESDSPPLLQCSLSKASQITGMKVNSLFALAVILKKELSLLKLVDVYEKIDAPLIPILAKMEFMGIRIDSEYFENLQKDFEIQLDKIEKDINQIIGVKNKKVNFRSPKQVGEILFERLQLPVIKKTKTGFSTDSDVLEELDSRNLSPVPAMVLKYRELDKLLSTYVKVLPKMINDKSGRLHANFNQHVAATGRLSSDDPNLQNIPVRTENGRKVRKGLVAKSGMRFLAADYSQVELRILAHFSKDPTMKRIFKEGGDIHVQTAAEVGGYSIDEVGETERSKAKAVNFGLMYGQSSFGLARSLRITRKEAREYITKYFERFGLVKGYIDSLKEYCETYGYSKTLHGRKRFLPDIHSQNRTIKSAAERVAINSPIQGTAADIVKIAMVEIDREITKKDLKSKMVLQVHDELIFEVPKAEEEKLKNIVLMGMEKVVKLNVPLKVQISLGKNWFDLK